MIGDEMDALDFEYCIFIINGAYLQCGVPPIRHRF